MNIVHAHKYYYKRDGASNHMFQIMDLAKDAGHRIIPFSMKDHNNLTHIFEKFFVSKMDLHDPKKLSFAKKIRFARKMIFNTEAEKNMEKVLEKAKVDIAHIHNIYHHISPSILPVLKKHEIPVVMTLHDYALFSPNYTLFHHGKIHEDDKRFFYLKGMVNKCVKDSFVYSALAALEMFLQQDVWEIYKKNIDAFICPSRFMQKKYKAYGWDGRKSIYLPHAIDTKQYALHTEDAGYVAYIGRLSEEKGVMHMCDLAKRNPKIPYVLVGTGPCENAIKERVAKEDITNLELVGFQTGNVLKKYIQDARIIVLPSLWYENYPLSILEAKAMGKIILGSSIGGIPELLPKECLFEPGNIEDLDNCVNFWYTSPFTKRQSVGKAFREEVMENNNPDTYRERLLDIYTQLC